MPKYQIIKSEYSPYTNKEILTIELFDNGTTNDLPTDCSAGSGAYRVGTEGLELWLFTNAGWKVI